MKPKHALVIAAVCVLAYAGALGAPFLFDDFHTIVENPYITSFKHVPGLFMPGKGWGVQLEHSGWRPLWYLSFTVNYFLGGFNPMGYHVVNVLLHLLNSLLVYALAWTLLRDRAGRPELAALFSGLIFAAHPIQTESVTYIVSRSALMVTFFYLASFLAYLRYRDKGGISMLALCAVTFLCAAMSKESAVTLPLMAAAYDFSARKRPRPYAAMGALAIVCAVYVAFRLYMAAAINSIAMPRSLPHHWMTEAYVFPQYIVKVLWPVNLSIDPEVWGVISPADPRFFISAAALVLVGYGIYKLYRADAAGGVAGFLAVWPFVALLPESVYPNLDFMAEHRLYLPMAGVAVLAGYAADRIYAMRVREQGPGAWRAMCIAAAAVILVSLFVMTLSRNRIFSSEVALWEDTVAKAPHNPRPAVAYGMALFMAGRADDARQWMEMVAEKSPDAPDVHSNLGFILLRSGRTKEALAEYLKALALRPDNYIYQTGTGSVYSELREYDKALPLFKAALRQMPDYALSHESLGAMYLQQGKAELALPELKAGIALDPRNPGAILNLGAAYLSLRQLDVAAREFNEVLRLTPEDANAHYDMAKTLRAMGDIEGAREHFRLFVRYADPNDPNTARLAGELEDLK